MLSHKHSLRPHNFLIFTLEHLFNAYVNTIRKFSQNEIINKQKQFKYDIDIDMFTNI